MKNKGPCGTLYMHLHEGNYKIVMDELQLGLVLRIGPREAIHSGVDVDLFIDREDMVSAWLALEKAFQPFLPAAGPEDFPDTAVRT